MVYDRDFKYPANYGHDPRTSKMVTGQSFQKTEWKQTDTTDCFSLPANAVEKKLHFYNSHGCSGLVISTSDCSMTGPRFESTPSAVVFNAITAAIYSLGHGLRTFTAVRRSTQPSTLRDRGTVK